MNDSATDQKALLVKMVISAWETQNKRVSDLIGKLTDEDLQRETAPGRNTGTYLLGHLTAISDAMIPILGWGDRRYSHLDRSLSTIPTSPDNPFHPCRKFAECGPKCMTRLTGHIASMTTDQWFERHTLVTPEDFAKQPFRNKLNIFINRSNHHSYHLGQMAYLLKREQES